MTNSPASTIEPSRSGHACFEGGTPARDGTLPFLTNTRDPHRVRDRDKEKIYIVKPLPREGA